MLNKLLPLAIEWKIIGCLLGVKSHNLDKIGADCLNVRDRLYEMLREWLKRVDPTPTWEELIEAVRAVDTSTAQEMSQYLAIAIDS